MPLWFALLRLRFFLLPAGSCKGASSQLRWLTVLTAKVCALTFSFRFGGPLVQQATLRGVGHCTIKRTHTDIYIQWLWGLPPRGGHGMDAAVGDGSVRREKSLAGGS